MAPKVRRRSPREPDRGAAAVEAALVIPMLLLLVFGIIDFGRMLNAQIKVTEAAREGSRAASLGVSRTNVRSKVYTVMGGNTDVTVSQVRCGSNPAASADARVTVTYRFKFITPVAALASLASDEFDLRATGVMPCHG